jgi:hypothetical protein
MASNLPINMIDIIVNANKGNKESKNVFTLHLRVSDTDVGIAAAELLIL